jgi:hypothetical protein
VAGTTCCTIPGIGGKNHGDADSHGRPVDARNDRPGRVVDAKGQFAADITVPAPQRLEIGGTGSVAVCGPKAGSIGETATRSRHHYDPHVIVLLGEGEGREQLVQNGIGHRVPVLRPVDGNGQDMLVEVECQLARLREVGHAVFLV